MTRKMDLKLSNYEVIYETLSASESDSDANESADNCASSCRRKENRARRKVIKNFVICQPIAQKKVSNKQALSNANNADREDYNLDLKNHYLDSTLENNEQEILWPRQNDRDLDDVDVKPVATNDTSINNPFNMSDSESPKLHKKIKSQTREIIWRVNQFMKKQTKNQGSNLFSKNYVKLTSKACGVSIDTVEYIIKEMSLRKGFSEEKFQEEQTGKDWSSVVNFVESCGPSMNAIEKVIEETVYRVLYEDLPPKFSGKTDIMGTIENCPDCNFSTLSKFLYKKHVALHENKPHLVFSQNVSGNSLNQFQPNLKQEFYQCPYCSDLFRTDTAMKYHKCVATTLSAGSSGMQASGFSNNRVAGDKYGGTALECALKFLNQKPIDIEIAKEQIVPLGDDNMISSVFNKDQFMKTLIDNKIDKLEKSVEELNKTVKAQNHFNVCTSNKLQEPEKQNIKQENIRANNNTNFFSSQKNAVHAKYLCKILEEPIDNKEETSALEEDCKHSFRLEEKIPDKLVLKGLNTKLVNVEETKKNTENNHIGDRTYDNLERNMAILTGEGNSDDKGLLKSTESGRIDSLNKTTLTTSNLTVNTGNSYIKSNNENKDKRFATTKRHSKNQTSHSCKLCDRIFKTHSSLKTHEHDEHFPNYFLCRICDYKSKIKIDLKKHYRKKHYDTYVRIFLK